MIKNEQKLIVKLQVDGSDVGLMKGFRKEIGEFLKELCLENFQSTFESNLFFACYIKHKIVN